MIHDEYITLFMRNLKNFVNSINSDFIVKTNYIN